jgi:CHRD domain
LDVALFALVRSITEVIMHTVSRTLLDSRLAVTIAAFALTLACGAASAGPIKAELTGAQEVPPVETKATGTAQFQLKTDRALSGSIKTKDIDGTAAHIHAGAPGVNGPVLITLNRKNSKEWTIPVGAKLTAEQVEALKAGTLYVNVHTDAHKGGEIRGQLKQ